MITCIRTNSDNKAFHELVIALDAELKINNGDADAFYGQFNKIDKIKYVVVAFANDLPVGCGAIKGFSANTIEVKRMFVPVSQRGNGIASLILKELESWSLELNYSRCILETGKKQQEAIYLYIKNGYQVIPNFGQYENIENSVCFEKMLI